MSRPAPLYMIPRQITKADLGKVTLCPADRWTAERIADLPRKEYRVKADRSRNLQQHKLLWALATIVADNHDQLASAEHAVNQWKLDTGLTEIVRYRVDGLGWIDRAEPKSINFGAMKQDEFSAWFEQVCELVTTHYLPGMSDEAIRAEIESMIAPQERQDAA